MSDKPQDITEKEKFEYKPEFVSKEDVEVLINHYTLQISNLRQAMKNPSSIEHYDHMRETRFALMRRRWHLRLHLKHRRKNN